MTATAVQRTLAWGTVGLFVVTAVVVAVAFPVHASDALTYGEWSRLIASHGGFDFRAVTAAAYNKPLLYVTVGWLWRIFGYSDTSGRLLCGVFGLVLVASMVAIATARPARRFAGAVAALFVLAIPIFAVQFVSMLTDVVVAAMVALTGAVLYAVRRAPQVPRALSRPCAPREDARTDSAGTRRTRPFRRDPSRRSARRRTSVAPSSTSR